MSRTAASAPASSANLGPGFDSLALALDLRCRVRAEPAASWSIRHTGPEPYRGGPENDGVLAAAKEFSTGPLRLEVVNHIPLSRGLGVERRRLRRRRPGRPCGPTGAAPAGANCFRHVRGPGGPSRQRRRRGLRRVGGRGGGRSVPSPPSRPTWRPVLAVPGFEMRTRESRKVIPVSITVEAAVRTIGRVAGLAGGGLRTGSGRTLELAGGDEIHEVPPHRPQP